MGIKKAPVLNRGNILIIGHFDTLSDLDYSLNYTPFLKRLLHQRTTGEQMHTEE